MQDWPMSGPDPHLEPVQRRGTRTGAAAAAAMSLLIVGFAVGLRVGGQPAPGTPVVAPPSSAPVVAAEPTPTEVAAPTATPFPEPVVKLDAVDPALQQAYYGAGAGVAICVVDAAPSCKSHSTVVPFADPNLPETFTDQAWAQLNPFEMVGHQFVAVEVLDAASVTATVLDVTDQPNDPFGYNAVVANPKGQGIYYIDLGSLATGQYVVVVRALVGPPAQGPASTGATYGWQTNLYALAVDPTRT